LYFPVYIFSGCFTPNKFLQLFLLRFYISSFSVYFIYTIPFRLLLLSLFILMLLAFVYKHSLFLVHPHFNDHHYLSLYLSFFFSFCTPLNFSLSFSHFTSTYLLLSLSLLHSSHCHIDNILETKRVDKRSSFRCQSIQSLSPETLSHKRK